MAVMAVMAVIILLGFLTEKEFEEIRKRLV
jgi:hypothetical protein